jgi:hypothetical protein
LKHPEWRGLLSNEIGNTSGAQTERLGGAGRWGVAWRVIFLIAGDPMHPSLLKALSTPHTVSRAVKPAPSAPASQFDLTAFRGAVTLYCKVSGRLFPLEETMELRDALCQIHAIRQPMARGVIVRGYRSLSSGCSGVLALLASPWLLSPSTFRKEVCLTPS